MKGILGLLLLIVVCIGSSSALVIPYAGGKQADSILIRTISYHAMLGTQSTLAGTTIQVGDVFSLSFRWKAATQAPTLCSMTDDEYGKIFLQVVTTGEARQLADSGTAWPAHAVRPPDSALISLAALPLTVDSGVPVGFRFAREGTCEGTSQSAAANWNRVIFIRNGSRYAKFSIVAKQDTSWGTLPYYGYIKSISFRYVVNETNELSDPVSIRHSPNTPKSRLDGRTADFAGYDFYNLLGVRLNREARPQEIVIPLRRSR